MNETPAIVVTLMAVLTTGAAAQADGNAGETARPTAEVTPLPAPTPGFHDRSEPVSALASGAQ